MSMLSDRERRFVAHRRVAHLATADQHAVPHVVPVCFALEADTLYIGIDGKPKRVEGLALKRMRNISANSAVALVVDHYDEDWTRLGWVMLHGRAQILSAGAEHDKAQRLLCERYPQLTAMNLVEQPVIAMRIERASSWGDLSCYQLPQPDSNSQ
jgi:PPOX class probable F420-dependent enzyme